MFILDAYLRDRGAEVNAALDARLPAAGTRPAVLHGAMRYSLFPGGKRLRPILCLAAADAVAPRATPAVRDAAMAAALAVEVLHTYTLVHDDLPCMDDDDERRGKPTVHRVYGDATAVLTGDALQALAFAWAAGADRTRPAVGGRLVAELATAAGSLGVVGGQVEDIEAVGRRPTRDDITFIHLHKTADLFRAAARMGGIAAGARPAALAALGTYGEQLGLAFQITDDLLDAPQAAPEDANAPPIELSCLSVISPAEAAQLADVHTEAACASLAGFTADARRPLEALARALTRRRH